MDEEIDERRKGGSFPVAFNDTGLHEAGCREPNLMFQSFARG
jgi:hypothetical protein